MRLCVQISVLSGNLTRVSELVAQLGRNIIEVEQERRYWVVPVRMAQIEILAEVRNSSDGHTLAECLADEDFQRTSLEQDTRPADQDRLA